MAKAVEARRPSVVEKVSNVLDWALKAEGPRSPGRGSR